MPSVAWRWQPHLPWAPPFSGCRQAAPQPVPAPRGTVAPPPPLPQSPAVHVLGTSQCMCCVYRSGVCSSVQHLDSQHPPTQRTARTHLAGNTVVARRAPMQHERRARGPPCSALHPRLAILSHRVGVAARIPLHERHQCVDEAAQGLQAQQAFFWRDLPTLFCVATCRATRLGVAAFIAVAK